MCDGCESETCQHCGGTGTVVTCWDDLCANGDHCIHGDGEADCPECQGVGEVCCSGGPPSAQRELAVRLLEEGEDPDSHRCRRCNSIYDGGQRCQNCGDANPLSEDDVE
jgi:hypothetical protein